jgi:uncharacterized protein (DUF2147 family)
MEFFMLKTNKTGQFLLKFLSLTLLFSLVTLNNSKTLVAAGEEDIASEADDVEGNVDPRDIFGYWNMYDFGNKQRVGIMYFYQYEGKVYGRMLVEFDGKTGEMIDNYIKQLASAPHIPTLPKVQGYDIMWNLEWNEKKQRWVDGYILDPRKKSPYNANAWRKNENEMKMRGGIPFLNLGMAITWDRCTPDQFPAGVPMIGANEQLIPRVYFNNRKVRNDNGFTPGSADDPAIINLAKA